MVIGGETQRQQDSDDTRHLNQSVGARWSESSTSGGKRAANIELL